MSSVTYYPMASDICGNDVEIRNSIFGQGAFVSPSLLTCTSEPPDEPSTFVTAHGHSWGWPDFTPRAAELTHRFQPSLDGTVSDYDSQHTPEITPPGLLSPDADNPHLVTTTWSARLRVLPHDQSGTERTVNEPEPGLTVSVEIQAWKYGDSLPVSQYVLISGSWTTVNVTLQWTSVVHLDEFFIKLIAPPPDLGATRHLDLDVACTSLTLASSGPEIPNLTGDLRNVRVRFSRSYAS